MDETKIEFQKIANDEYLVLAEQGSRTGLPMKLGVLSPFQGEWFFAPVERNTLGGQVNLSTETLFIITKKLVLLTQREGHNGKD